MTGKQTQNGQKRPRKRLEIVPDGELLASDAAKRLEITKQSVGLWASKVGAPVRRDGNRVYVRWPDFMRWREEQLCRSAVEEATKKLRAQLEAASGSKGGDPGQRLLEANARKAELDVAALEASMVRVVDAEAVVEKVFSDLRSQLIPFPRTAAPKLLGAKTLQDLESRLDTEVHRLMELLAGPVEMVGSEQSEAA